MVEVAVGAGAAAPSDVGAPLVPRRPWVGRRVLLGVTGGIAAYKSVQLARDLTRLGAVVDVVMTEAAQQFVGPITFEALTGRPPHTRIIAQGHALDHIRLAREAEVICSAPATADFIARAAAGRAHDLLSAILLASSAPVLICPAMNDAMWAHAQTQANVARCRELGYRIVGPAEGPLAYGEGSGPGRFEDPVVILEHIGRALEQDDAFPGRRVVVTAGPTREPLDAVRVLTNRSSGRMGYALAAAAWRRGAEVLLIAGPSDVSPPPAVPLQRVETAAQMVEAVAAALPQADILIMAAAVADFRPAHPVAGKVPKSEAPASLPLEPAPDVLLSTRAVRRPGIVAVGFALETGDGRDKARQKLLAKGLDLVVLNAADEPGAGFDVPTNRVTLISSSGSVEELPLAAKTEVAEQILDRIAPLIRAR